MLNSACHFIPRVINVTLTATHQKDRDNETSQHCHTAPDLLPSVLIWVSSTAVFGENGNYTVNLSSLPSS